MKLLLFNPEHDLALAANLSNFTAPHAGRQLHTDLGYLPALWATADDYVLVDDADEAQTAFSRLMHRQFPRFVEKRQLTRFDITSVEPWGWDLALRSFLLRSGVRPEACASEAAIADIRELSHRCTAVTLLSQISPLEVPMVCETVGAVEKALSRWDKVVIKAPWSSSGRGIRFVERVLDDYQRGWLQNILERQGSVVVEPYYNKVKDFAMEFESDGQGLVTYRGLSLFQTSNGAYTGNILASEEEKLTIISPYASKDSLDTIQQNICRHLGPVFASRYKGPFGVDMMIVARPDKDGYLLHPCVEINLRRTMGHVALALQQEGVMQIVYSDKHYKLKINRK